MVSINLFSTYHLTKHATAGSVWLNPNGRDLFCLCLLLQPKCRCGTSLERLLPAQLARRTRQSRNTSSFFSMVDTSLSCRSFLCARVSTRHGARGGHFSSLSFCPPSPVTQTSGTQLLKFLVRNAKQHAQALLSVIMSCFFYKSCLIVLFCFLQLENLNLK